MKKIIKISIIAVVVVAIIVVAALFVHSITSLDSDPIVPQPFVSKILDRVKNEVEGKGYSAATKGYDAILEEIQTECFVRLSDGNRYVSKEDELECRRSAFDVYCGIFIEYAKGFFEGSSWSVSSLRSIRDRAQQLRNTGFAEKGTDYDNGLNYCIATVNDYFAAWSVVKSANNCTSISSVEYVKNTAKNYMHAPLTNNSSLNSGLNQAFAVAKTSYARYINSYCDRVANNYWNHSNYDGFLKEYNKASALIKGFKNNYGEEYLFSNSESKIYKADQDAMKYYK